MSSNVLEVRGLTKRFGNFTALDDVSLTVRQGSVHALLGMNGSGKSTLVKIISGFTTHDEGAVQVGAKSFVHQDLGLLPSLTVVENFGLGRPLATRAGRIDRREEARRAREALAEFGLEDRIDHPVQRLSAAERTVVALARALDHSLVEGESPGLLVLDEPTSGLPSREIELMARAMRRCAEKGHGVLFITHRLQEVMSLADELTVLRNGAVVHQGSVADIDIPGIVRAMVGERGVIPGSEAVGEPLAAGDTVVQAVGLGGETFRGLDLSIRGGEVVGVFGMLDSGIDKLGAVLAGREVVEEGQVAYLGSPFKRADRRRREVGYVPSDRPRRGIFAGLSVSENISIRSLPSVTRHGIIRRYAEYQLGKRWGEELETYPADPALPIATLSGGNQQKAVLSRWLAIEPRLIVAEEPTQGIDIHAKAHVLKHLRAAARRGAAVIFTAVDPEELLDSCDRVVVLRHGEVALDVPRHSTNLTDVLATIHRGKINDDY